MEEQNLQEYLCGGLSCRSLRRFAGAPTGDPTQGQKQHTVVLQGAVQTLKHTLVSEPE